MGNDKSGNSYAYVVSPTSEFGEILNVLISETGAGLGKGTWTKRLILQHYEKEFREISKRIYDGKDYYDEFWKNENLRTDERKELKRKLEQEKIENQQKKLNVKKEKLNVQDTIIEIDDLSQEDMRKFYDWVNVRIGKHDVEFDELPDKIRAEHYWRYKRELELSSEKKDS
jgi:hypothetical protein